MSITTPGTCNETGDAFIPGEACPDNGACVDGQCKSGCSGLVKYGTSYIGCEYWSVDLDQYDDPAGDPKNAPYGVVISNPGSDTATITFEMGNGDTFEPVDPTVPGGSAKQFILPTLNDDGTGISQKSVRILGDRPITVHQFNPLDNLSQVASNDASLLLPANVLGTDYYVLTWPTTPIGAIGILPEGEIFGDCCTDSDCAGGEVCCEFFGISTSCEESCSFPQSPSTCTEEGGGQGGLENQHGYFTVVAASAGTTTVTIDVTADVLAGPGVEEMPAGSSQTFGLEQFDVLTLQAAPIGEVDFFNLGSLKLDLTGSRVQSDKPVVVFAGHEEAVVGEETEEKDNCCAEHLEEQLFPVSTWGSQLICAKTKPRSNPPEPDYWRVIASVDGTILTTDPVVDGIHGKTLNAGEWAEASTPLSFRLIATHPIQVAQYTIGQGLTDSFTGDPSLILAVPEEQFRKDYIILTPSGYSENYLTVVRPTGVEVLLDGVPLADTLFDPMAGGDWEIAYVTAAEGSHTLASESPFGISAYGWSNAVSYGFPGGLNLE